MNFNIYTKTEKEKLLNLKSDFQKAIFKMYGEKPIDLLKENPLFLEGQEERKKALQEREKIRFKAFNRFKDKILKHEEQYLKTAKNKVNSYSDLKGAIFLKKFDDHAETLNKKEKKFKQQIKFDALKMDIEQYISDIYTRVYSSDSANLEPAKEILDKVDHIIDYRAVKVLAHYNDLIKENRLEEYLQSSDQIEGQQSFKPDKKEDLSKYIEIQAQNEDLFFDNLFLDDYIPMNYGEPTTAVMKMNTRVMKADNFSGNASFIDDKGNQIIASNFNTLLSKINTNGKKILDAAVLSLTDQNYYRSSNVLPKAQIPLLEYWKSCGLKVEPDKKEDPEEQAIENKKVINYIKTLKNALKNDLTALSSIKWTGKGTGKNKGDFANIGFISSFYVKKNVLTVVFDYEMAKFLINSYQMQFPTALFKHDSRDPNSYAIGRRIAMHNSMDNNAKAGTANTLSVKTLLEAAPEIMSYEDMLKSGNRNWKRNIKARLEAALNSNINIGYLKEWQYRNTKTKDLKTYTEEEADLLSWDNYYSLVVDFVLVVEPDQKERRSRRAAEAEAKAKELNKPKPKRGRPRKNTPDKKEI